MAIREVFLRDVENILSAVRSGMAPDPRGPDGSTRLQNWLYQYCFCNSLTVPVVASDAASSGNLLAQLSAANTGKDLWDTGWEISAVDGAGRVTAKRYESVRNFWPGEFLTIEGPELPPRAGMHLRVFFPRESSTMQPGFYFAFGNSPEEDFDPLCTVRFYWAVKSSGAVLLTGELTGALNRLRVPFRFKTGIETHSYGRLDAAVLYIHKRFYQIAARLMAPVYGRVRGALMSGVPIFTKPLAPGLGLAEDPGTGESFGMQRCRLLAEAILAAVELSLDAVIQQLELAGVRADCPYLSPGSADQYDFSLADGAA
jgi:HopA1 effector protein family